MKKYFTIVPIALSAALFPLAAEESKSEEKKPAFDIEKDLNKISKSFGHLIGQNVLSLNMDFNIDQVVVGIQEALKGMPSPMSEADTHQALNMIQEHSFQRMAKENLQKAEEFLAKNKTEKDVVELAPGKLQYVKLNDGKGDVVEPHFSPVIRYVGKFLDGKTFGESHEDEVISLETTIPGFSQAIAGMKEGEKRRIFIHPELGYGSNGFLPPNSLLTFDIEVVKANAPKSENEALSSSRGEQTHPELATLDSISEGTR